MASRRSLRARSCWRRGRRAWATGSFRSRCAICRRRFASHAAQPIDFASLRGKRVAVIGAGASAFDNAATALEAGAAEVHLFCRRARDPGDPALSLAHLPRLPAASLRSRRCLALALHARRSSRCAKVFRRRPTTAARVTPIFTCTRARRSRPPGRPIGGVELQTPSGAFAADFVICGTGIDMNFAGRARAAKLRRQHRDLGRPLPAAAGRAQPAARPLSLSRRRLRADRARRRRNAVDRRHPCLRDRLHHELRSRRARRSMR